MDTVRPQGQPVITAQNLSYSYGSIHALEQISISIQGGTLTAIVGPNGGGKSTLIKALARLHKPNSGKVTQHIPPENFAYLPQRSDIDRTFPLKVEDVVAMGLWQELKSFGRMSPLFKKRVSDSLELVGLEGFGKRSLYELSGGQTQRMLFARLAIQDAQIMLLDEPFAAVDQRTVQDLMALIGAWHQAGKTIITVLHDIQLVLKSFPQAILLARKLYGHGETKEILTEDNLKAAAFAHLAPESEGTDV